MKLNDQRQIDELTFPNRQFKNETWLNEAALQSTLNHLAGIDIVANIWTIHDILLTIVLLFPTATDEVRALISEVSNTLRDKAKLDIHLDTLSGQAFWYIDQISLIATLKYIFPEIEFSGFENNILQQLADELVADQLSMGAADGIYSLSTILRVPPHKLTRELLDDEISLIKSRIDNVNITDRDMAFLCHSCLINPQLMRRLASGGRLVQGLQERLEVIESRNDWQLYWHIAIILKTLLDPQSNLLAPKINDYERTSVEPLPNTLLY